MGLLLDGLKLSDLHSLYSMGNPTNWRRPAPGTTCWGTSSENCQVLKHPWTADSGLGGVFLLPSCDMCDLGLNDVDGLGDLGNLAFPPLPRDLNDLGSPALLPFPVSQQTANSDRKL